MAYVFDTSALIAHFRDEPEADQVEAVFRGSESLALPFVAVMEARYVLARAYARAQVDDFIETLRASRLQIIESFPEWGAAAADVKARGGLSLADAWIASLALLHDAELLHKDPEFDRVEGLKSARLR